MVHCVTMLDQKRNARALHYQSRAPELLRILFTCSPAAAVFSRRRLAPACTPVVTNYVEFGRTDELSRLSVPERHRLSLCIALVLASACCAVVGPL